jgi:2-keto-3-deoxy-L-rhamnonate aldolase RhmA
MGHALADAWTHPDVLDAMAQIVSTALAAGLVTAVHAGDGAVGNRAAQMGFRMITLASESQALRKGAAAHLAAAKAQSDARAVGERGYH